MCYTIYVDFYIFLSFNRLTMKGYIYGWVMKRLVYFLILLSLLQLLGCAHTPYSSSYPLGFQYKMQSVHHWDILSNDVADQIRTALIDKKLIDSPIFVQPDRDTPFAEGFHNMLVTSLVNKGDRKSVV
jgi:hypothetical protein